MPELMLEAGNKPYHIAKKILTEYEDKAYHMITPMDKFYGIATGDCIRLNNKTTEVSSVEIILYRSKS